LKGQRLVQERFPSFGEGMTLDFGAISFLLGGLTLDFRAISFLLGGMTLHLGGFSFLLGAMMLHFGGLFQKRLPQRRKGAKFSFYFGRRTFHFEEA
jgi:hypothetical protein